MMETVAFGLAGFCLLIGAGFALVGVVGLLKLPDSMTRLHAPTKVGTIGVGALLLAAILTSLAAGELSLQNVLIMAFLFVTAPITAHFLAKTNIHEGACTQPPELPDGEQWSTYVAAPQDDDVDPKAAP